MPPMTLKIVSTYTQLIIPTVLLEPRAKLLTQQQMSRYLYVFAKETRKCRLVYINITNIECILTRKHFSVDVSSPSLPSLAGHEK